MITEILEAMDYIKHTHDDLTGVCLCLTPFRKEQLVGETIQRYGAGGLKRDRHKSELQFNGFPVKVLTPHEMRSSCVLSWIFPHQVALIKSPRETSSATIAREELRDTGRTYRMVIMAIARHFETGKRVTIVLPTHSMVRHIRELAKHIAGPMYKQDMVQLLSQSSLPESCQGLDPYLVFFDHSMPKTATELTMYQRYQQGNHRSRKS